MTSKVVNGSGMGAPRPPFRRQGSSIGAGVHPMTVALPPVQKVDYSVTKGGARTWAVLLVFMFLCSSLYTVFSTKEAKELAVDTDISEDQDDLPGQHHKNMRDTTLFRDIAPEDYRRVTHKSYEETSDQYNIQTDVKLTDADDEAEQDSGLEHQLFAGLRKKIEKNMQRAKDIIVERTFENSENEEKPESARRPRRRKKKELGQLMTDNGKKEEEEHIYEIPRSRKNRKTRKEAGNIEDVNPNENNKKQGGNEDEGIYGKGDDSKKADMEKGEDIYNEEAKNFNDFLVDDYESIPQRKERRLHRTRHIMEIPSHRQCRRKNCPPEYSAEPRRNLLKKKNKVEFTSNKKYRMMSKEDIEECENESKEDDAEINMIEVKEEKPAAELINTKKYRSTDREAYKRHAITNKDDHKHRDTLDKADYLAEKHEYSSALSLFNSVLHISPESPRAHFGKGRTFDIRGEYLADEKDTDQALAEYQKVLDIDGTPDALFRQAASRFIQLARFRGNLHHCLTAQRALIDRFPTEIKHQTDFGLTFVMMRRLDDARKIFHDVLEIDPNNGVAYAYYGYILKVVDNDIELGVAYMRKGLRLGQNMIMDAKLYHQLGHSLMYLGRTADAYSVYEQGAALGLFLSAQQRSMYNMEGLTGRPWWSIEQTGYVKHLKAIERQWVSVRAEAVRLLQDAPNSWREENPALTVDGRWMAFPLMESGQFIDENCKSAPLTCAILKEFRETSNASKTEMRFSVLTSGAQVLSHCGSSNCRLQAQLGLVVPSEARIRVGTEQRGWKTGKFIIFDDSFEHEMLFDGASSSSFRLVLLVDLWHPEVEFQYRSNNVE